LQVQTLYAELVQDLVSANAAGVKGYEKLNLTFGSGRLPLCSQGVTICGLLPVSMPGLSVVGSGHTWSAWE